MLWRVSTHLFKTKFPCALRDKNTWISTALILLVCYYKYDFYIYNFDKSLVGR